ncbi:hypothetical protein SAMN02745148_02403 [Modicisalibacter ilicicola DSM 19980]|uniref:Uncharacterized protein n=1 Tax=Modicisalibacter ilicicola DSM 19980 TaxID=1121942 RepID=A0A1M5AZ06_9GAMM|nr:hypothetical protein [Halomonas ilicicola]SHF35521.1 hypothetical protein SAMN02745148_02403 [Halomonas ilicicola DSM 19980]
MLEWISQNSKVLSFFTNLGILIIWLAYAQLLYMGFRRQRRPRLIINRGKKKDIEALCIISNMSAEAIFIEYIIADLETSEGTITMDVTDFDQEYTEGDENRKRDTSPGLGGVRENTRQGPLESGDFLHIGTFAELIKRLARDEGIEMEGHRPTGDLRFQRLTIRLIGVYGPEDMPIGAERSFDLFDNDNFCSLTPATWDTKRLSSPWQRRKLRKTMQSLNERNFSSSSNFRHVADEESDESDQEETREAAAEASRKE